ncbi:hypothetical protein Tco_0780324 [Tanacetum coccineum]
MIAVVAAVECVERFLFQDHDFLRCWEGKIDNTESCNVDDLTSQHCRYLARLMPLIREENTIVSGPDLFSQSDYYPENKAVNEDGFSRTISTPMRISVAILKKTTAFPGQYVASASTHIYRERERTTETSVPNGKTKEKEIDGQSRKGFRYGIRSNRQTAMGGSDTVINLWHDSTAADKAKAVEIEEEESVQKSFVFSTQNNTVKGFRELLEEAITTIIKPKSLKVENGSLVDKSKERTEREEETKELSSAKEVEENENVACFFCCDSGSDGSGFARSVITELENLEMKLGLDSNDEGVW